VNLRWNRERGVWEPDADKRARLVIADPAWIYSNFGAKKHGAVRAHYPTMKLPELCALPVNEWVADDAILALWATWPKLNHAFAVLEAWGFDYVTGFPWVKTVPSSGEIKTGIGFWTQATSEPLLIARRGKIKREKVPPVMGLATDLTSFEQEILRLDEDRVLWHPRSKHSQKPQSIHEWLGKLIPGPKLELFARRRTPGWLCLGFDLGWALTSRGIERAELQQLTADPGTTRATD